MHQWVQNFVGDVTTNQQALPHPSACRVTGQNGLLTYTSYGKVPGYIKRKYSS